MLHILLDAEAFRHEHLHFASKRFQQLTAFVAAQESAVYVTDITIGEVRRAIATAVGAALDLLSKKTRGALGILVQTDKAGRSSLLRLPDQTVLVEALNAVFERLLGGRNAVDRPSLLDTEMLRLLPFWMSPCSQTTSRSGSLGPPGEGAPSVAELLVVAGNKRAYALSFR